MAAGRKHGEEDTADDDAGELLALPPEHFTEARNALAKRLRGEGRRDAADAIKALPRPTVALWALNAVARDQPALVEAFLACAEDLREAYRSGGDIRAATGPERDAEAAVVSAAAALARAEGRNVTETVMDRLRQTMRAAAADTAIGAELHEARLLREPDAPSIDELLGSLPARSAPATGAKGAAKPDRGAERSALRAEIAEAKEAAAGARGDARAAAAAAREARTALERAEKLAERAQRASDAADERVADLQGRLEET